MKPKLFSQVDCGHRARLGRSQPTPSWRPAGPSSFFRTPSRSASTRCSRSRTRTSSCRSTRACSASTTTGKVVPAVAESIRNVDPLNWDIKIRRGPDLPQRRADQRRCGGLHLRSRQEAFRRRQGRPHLRARRPEIRPGREDRRLHRALRDAASRTRSSPSHLVNPEVSILPPKYYTENPPEKVVFAPGRSGRLQVRLLQGRRRPGPQGVRQVSARQAAGRRRRSSRRCRKSQRASAN